MKIIYKYKINAGITTIEMPTEAKFLCVNTQGEGNDEEAFIWALVDNENPKETRHFYATGTGWDMESQLKKENKYAEFGDYLGTIFLKNWGLVFHLFEVKA